MKLIIDIPDDDFLACKHWVNEGVAQWVESIIANGTPLPKGHGRLIDADALNRKDVNCANVPMNFIDTAPTVIEADKEKKNDY